MPLDAQAFVLHQNIGPHHLDPLQLAGDAILAGRSQQGAEGFFGGLGGIAAHFGRLIISVAQAHLDVAMNIAHQTNAGMQKTQTPGCQHAMQHRGHRQGHRHLGHRRHHRIIDDGMNATGTDFQISGFPIPDQNSRINAHRQGTIGAGQSGLDIRLKER